MFTPLVVLDLEKKRQLNVVLLLYVFRGNTESGVITGTFALVQPVSTRRTGGHVSTTLFAIFKEHGMRDDTHASTSFTFLS